MRVWRCLGAALFGVAAIGLVFPLVIPMPPLHNAVPPAELADPDSLFIQINGLRVHYKMSGDGAPTLVLLHGFASSTFTWQSIMPGLATRYTVIAYDRPAFGLTERPMPGEWAGDSPYSPQSQTEMLVALMDRLEVQRAVLVGHSQGGAIAALAALRYPERIERLILVAPVIYAPKRPDFWRWMMDTPYGNYYAPLLARYLSSSGQATLQNAWNDPAGVTPHIVAGYSTFLRAENWDRALWEQIKANDLPDIAAQLAAMTIPTLIITGDNDRIVPIVASRRVAADLGNAKLVVISACGHVPQEEKPDAFVRAIEEFVQSGNAAASTGQ